MKGWPNQRNLFFRPERRAYVKKEMKTKGCVFCRAEKLGKKFESLCVYQSEHSMVLINKYPYNTGHLLVLPRRHEGSLLNLAEEEYQDIHQLLKVAMKCVYEIYKPDAVNIGMNHGEVAGAGIPLHLHYHILPRWKNDTNFFPLIAQTKVLIETLDQTYSRVSAYFEKSIGVVFTKRPNGPGARRKR